MGEASMSDIEELELGDQQTIWINAPCKRGNSLFGWSIPPNLERASPAREGKVIEKPAVTPAARLDDDKRNTLVVPKPGEGPASHYVHFIPLLRARLAYFAIRYEDFDTHCDFAGGLTGKCLGPAMVKRFGIEKLFDALAGSGLRLRVEEDPEQTAKMKARIEANYIPRQATQARPGNHSHLSNKMIDEVLTYLANKKGGLTVLNNAVKDARSNMARHGAKARWQTRRADGPVDFTTYSTNPCNTEAAA
jgi:hypothetical protein